MKVMSKGYSMKKEQESALLTGCSQVVALLNLYSYMQTDRTQKVLKASKSSRRKENNSQEMVLAQMGYSTVLTTLNLLAPFLVSLGVNLAYDEETDEYSLVYKDRIVEMTDEGQETFLENLLKRAEEA